ncbi:MAG: MFS transporter [Alphaproteobacteria bacterium]
MKHAFSFGGLGLRIAALGVAQIINWGALYYTLALIGPKIITETGWSEGFVYSGFAIATLLIGAVGPLSGRLVDRHGGRSVMICGTLIAASGMVILSQADNTFLFLVAWAVMGLGMSACLYDSSFASLAQLAGPTTRRAISGLTLVAGFSSTVTWPITSALLVHTNWRGVCLFDAIIMLCVSGPLIFFALRKPYPPLATISATDLDEDSERAKATSGKALVPKDKMLKAMILFALTFTTQGFVLNAMSIHVLSLFETLGMSAGAAMIAGTLIGPSQVAARFIELLFGRSLSVMGLGLVTMALFPVALAIPLILPPTIATACIYGLVYGASAGLSTIARGVMPYELFGAERYGRRLGLLAAPALLAKAFAPATIALIAEAKGPVTALSTCIAIALIALLATIALDRTVRSTR